MNYLVPLNFSIKEIIEKCISNYRDADLKNRFTDSISFIENETKIYLEKSKKNKLDEINEHEEVNSISKKEMVKLYDVKFVQGKIPRSKYYDKILSNTKSGLCPYCNQIIADTLDHFLQKSKYPTFSISPINLVPSCSSCNKTKENTKITGHHLHPYFDNVENIKWLKAEIYDFEDIKFRFHVDPLLELDHILIQKIENHIGIFNLVNTFGIYAKVELNNNKYHYQTTFNTSGRLGLKNTIDSQYKTYLTYNKNSWQTALFGCLRDSNWFLDHGVHLI
jgi:5-methylcytosine-specific restriction endonuclease McrA